MDYCSLCGVSRPEHDDPNIHHAFALEGDGLVAKNSGRVPPPTNPTPSGVDRIMLNLLGVMANKGLLSPEDLSLIMGGNPIGIRRSTPETD